MEVLERDEHLQRLGGFLTQAATGRGRIVAVAGEAGAGKTTLAARFLAAHAAEVRAFWGACEHLATPEPLLPLRDIARASGGALVFDPQADHLSRFEALLDLLLRGDAPGVMVLEDAHWADAATLDLVRFLSRRVARGRALILVTYRDEEVGARSPLRDVLGEAPAGSVERLTLEPLSLAAVTRLAARVGRRGDEIYALTGGNPFLVTEMLAVEGDAPPDTVRDATLARAARLPATGRRVLEAVSIFPRTADARLVAELVGADFAAGVDACVEKGMLALEGDALRFRHEIARRAIEGALAPTRRKDLHQRAVDALKGRPDARASEIAHHAERADDAATLVTYARRAGEEAARMGACREAAAHYAAALRRRSALDPKDVVDVLERHAEQSYLMGDPQAALESMKEAAERRGEIGDAIRLGRDMRWLSRFAWASGLRTEAESYAGKAIAILEAEPVDAELAWAYSNQSQLDMLAWKRESAIAWGERAIALAEQLHEREILTHALTNVGSARLDRDGPRASAELERGLEIARALELHDHAERAWCNLACSSVYWLEYAAALERIEAGVAYAAERDLTHWEAYLRGWRATVNLERGEWARAEEEAEEVTGWASAPRLFRFPALVALARLRVRRGEPDWDAPLDAARSLSATAAELQRQLYVAAIEAEVCWLGSGASDGMDEGRVLAQLRDLHASARRQEVDAWGPGADATLWLHLLGRPIADPARLTSPFREHCAGRWRDAAAGWAAHERPYEEAIALSEGDEDAQRRALAIFDRLGAAPAAARLRRRMRAAGVRSIPRGPIGRTRANPAGLTRRQAQVLALIDEGLSNAEIADRLCISAKTAEHHVCAVMARLGAGSRREAAAAGRARGLLEAPQN